MPKEPKAPKSINEHQYKYKSGKWTLYSIFELGNWVHLFAKRALNRNTKEKADKDLLDAQNYLNMMQSHLDSLKSRVAKMK